MHVSMMEYTMFLDTGLEQIADERIRCFAQTWSLGKILHVNYQLLKPLGCSCIGLESAFSFINFQVSMYK